MHVSQHYIIISVTTGSLVNSHTQLIEAFIRALECLHEDTIQFADRLRECEFHAPQRMANGQLVCKGQVGDVVQHCSGDLLFW